MALALLALSGASPAGAAYPGREGAIAIACDGCPGVPGGNPAVFRVGPSDRFLAVALRRGDGPTFSPRGSALAAGIGPGRGIVVLASDGRVRRLTRPPLLAVDRDPTWSPDGRRLLFLRARDRSVDLMSVAANGRGGRRLLADAGVGGLAWAPAGDLVAVIVVGDTDHGGSVGLMRSDGTGLRVLAPGWSVEPDGSIAGSGSASRLDWAPGGSRLAVVWADADGIGSSVELVDRRTGARTVLLHSALTIPAVAFSPRGDRLVVALPRRPRPRQNAVYDIAVVSLPAGERRLLARGLPYVSSLDWQAR
ncbi:MAG: hypothetical protein R3C15_14320 [Thermoleophilia bacterium]